MTRPRQGKDNTTFVVSWTASPATGAPITYAVTDSNGNQVGQTTGTQVTVTYASSQVGKTLTFTVVATDTAGSSAPSANSIPIVGIDTLTLVGSAQSAVGSAGSKTDTYTKSVTVPAVSGSETGSAVSVSAGVEGAGTVTVRPTAASRSPAHSSKQRPARGRSRRSATSTSR